MDQVLVYKNLDSIISFSLYFFFKKKDAIDKTQARHLTLVAKVVQNLGNLVEFGYKEPFMNVLNPFIMEKMPDLKKFIEEISVLDFFFFFSSSLFSFLLLTMKI